MTNEEIGTALTDLKINISAYRAEATAQNCVTNAALVGVNQRLDKINGSVERHERIISERAIVVRDFQDFKDSYKDVPTQIRKLEDESLSNKSMKKFAAMLFTGGMAIGGLIAGILKLILN
jgi:hypothetical protein